MPTNSTPGKYNGDLTVARLGSSTSSTLPLGNITYSPSVPADNVLISSGPYERIKFGTYESPLVASYGSIYVENGSFMNWNQVITWDAEGASQVYLSSNIQDSPVSFQLPNLKYASNGLDLSLTIGNYPNANTEVNAPELEYGGSLTVNTNKLNFSFPKLKYGNTYNIELYSCIEQVDIIQPLLERLANEVLIRCWFDVGTEGVQTISMPNLISVPSIDIQSLSQNSFSGSCYLNSVNFPSLQYCRNFRISGPDNYIATAFIGTSISLPSLVNNGNATTYMNAFINSDMGIAVRLEKCPYLETISLGSCSMLRLELENAPLLTSLPLISIGTYQISNCTSITDQLLPKNTVHVTYELTGLNQITNLNLPNAIQTGIYLATCANVTQIDLPSVEILDQLQTSETPILTDVNIGPGLKQVGFRTGNTNSKIMINGPLNQTSVDNILVRLAALDGTNGTTLFENEDVSLGINYVCSSPSQIGIDAIATLIARNCSVIIND